MAYEFNPLAKKGFDRYTSDSELPPELGALAVDDTNTVDLTLTGDTLTADVKDGSITYAKIQNISATSRILGRVSAGAGSAEELTAANVRTIINVEDGADVTDTANVTSAGALMDSELTDLAGIKALDTSTIQTILSEGAFVDGDKTKLDGIEALADVTDATNVAAAGAAMAGGAFHDGFSDFVANEHIDWTADQGATNINAANIPDLSGTYQPLNAVLTELTALTDPGADRVVIWNDTTNNFEFKDYTNWDTAFGWGNHAGLYETTGSIATHAALQNVHGLNITAAKTLTVQDDVTITGALGSAAYADTGDFAAALGEDDNYVTDAEKIVIGNTSGENTGDQIVPDNEAGSANNFLTAYNNATGAWTKARPTWANIDKTTSDIADLTTKSHTSLSDIGTNTHAQIDTFIGTTVPTDYALKGQTFYIGTTQVAINRASAALTLEGLTLTTPNIGEATGDSITLTTTAATRENIFTASVSDAGNDKFGIGNATTVASRFIPNIYGYVESVDSLQSFGFSGMVKDTNDASSSSTNGIIDFRAMRTDNTTNPEAGTFSAIQNRNLYTFRNATTVLWTIPAGGHLYSGTDGTGLYDIKTGGNITSGDITTIGDLTVGGVAQATSVDVANGSTIFGSNDDLTMTVTQHASAPALNLYPAGGSLTSSRFAFRCVEGTSNFARFQGCTGTNAALASSNTMGIIEFEVTQADPDPLKGVINFWTNSGDSIAVKATLNETGVFNAVGGFSDNGSAGIDTTFVDNDGNTITVKGGIITAKTAP